MSGTNHPDDVPGSGAPAPAPARGSAWWRWARTRAEGRAFLRSTGRLIGVTRAPKSRLVERSGSEVGRAPGMLVVKPDAAPAVIATFRYDAQGAFEERQGVSLDEAAALADAPGVTWIDVENTADTVMIARLGEAYRLHPLVQEDIANANQRPKMEDYGEDQLFVVVKMVNPGDGPSDDAYADGRCDHEVEQVGFVLTAHHLLSFQEGAAGDVFEPVRERLRHRSNRLRDHGPDFLFYALLDAIVDHYFVTLERIGDATERYELDVFRAPTPRLLGSIQSLRRETVVIRRVIWPLREVLAGLLRDETALITEKTRVYLRDVYDHLIQAVDTVETIRDVLDGLVDHYLSSVSYRTNEVMRVLTVVGTVFLPLTFIAGVYGMNFDPDTSPYNMPELRWRYGYPATMLLLLLLSAAILLVFKRRGYLGGRDHRL